LTPTAVTDEQILKYFENQTTTIRQVADRIYRAIQEAGLTADMNMTGTNASVAQGYWMIADVTSLTGNEANSLVMIDTKGEIALTITPKTALPTVEKKVKDIDDSEDDSITDNAWHDSADHDINDAVPFKLTATLPENVQAYKSYKMVFHDVLSAGLTLDTDSFKVYMYDTKLKADVDTDLNDYAKDVTASFVPKTTGLSDGCTFEVACDNVYSIDGVTKDTAFVVYYEAALNENAVIGGAGNPNEVYLEFSNDPYGNGTGKTETDKVAVFTYKLVINKTDSHGHALAGAGFTLYKKDKISGTYQELNGELGGVGSSITTFEWAFLDDGDYMLVETTVPGGYNKMDDVLFSVSAEHTETGVTLLDGDLMGTGDSGTGTIAKDIVNHTGTVLPSTGAEGTMMLIVGGSMLIAVAAVFMITRKKMSIYED